MIIKTGNVVLILVILTVLKLLNYTNASTCKAYQCTDDTLYWSESTDTTVFLNPGSCSSDQECFFSGNEYGRCAPK